MFYIHSLSGSFLSFCLFLFVLPWCNITENLLHSQEKDVNDRIDTGTF